MDMSMNSQAVSLYACSVEMYQPCWHRPQQPSSSPPFPFSFFLCSEFQSSKQKWNVVSSHKSILDFAYHVQVCPIS